MQTSTRTLAKRTLQVALLLASAAAMAQSVSCPIDNMGMYFTGVTRTEMGRLLYQYKCPNGHVTWVVQ